MNSQCNNILSKSLRHILEVGGTLGDPKGVKKKQYVHADRPLKRQIMLFLRISVRTMVSQDVPQVSFSPEYVSRVYLEKNT